jgi:hypothetical protein
MVRRAGTPCVSQSAICSHTYAPYVHNELYYFMAFQINVEFLEINEDQKVKKKKER